ncbi:MAG: hypothetical protein ABEJ77_05315 [Halanaeroarchaeum sp.]
MENREGTPVDPVPWIVTSGFAFLFFFSVGPIYLRAYGLTLGPALAVCVGLFLGAVVAAYWRYVYTARPAARAEVDPQLRLERLFYGVIAGIIVLTAISLPLLARQG